jgi:hypothetical protein
LLNLRPKRMLVMAAATFAANMTRPISYAGQKIALGTLSVTARRHKVAKQAVQSILNQNKIELAP